MDPADDRGNPNANDRKNLPRDARAPPLSLKEINKGIVGMVGRGRAGLRLCEMRLNGKSLIFADHDIPYQKQKKRELPPFQFGLALPVCWSTEHTRYTIKDRLPRQEKEG